MHHSLLHVLHLLAGGGQVGHPAVLRTGWQFQELREELVAQSFQLFGSYVVLVLDSLHYESGHATNHA